MGVFVDRPYLGQQLTRHIYLSASRAVGPRVLVISGRDYLDRTQVFLELDELKPSTVLHRPVGAASVDLGAFAATWCRARGVQELALECGVSGRRGERIIEEMRDGGFADLALAFPGADRAVISALAARGVAVKEVPAYTRVVHCRRHPYNVYGGRPGPFGNPFSYLPGTLASCKVETREEAIERHQEWFLANPDLLGRVKLEMAGKVIGCWCAPKPCHCDIYATVCNEAAGLANGSQSLNRSAQRAGVQNELFETPGRLIDEARRG